MRKLKTVGKIIRYDDKDSTKFLPLLIYMIVNCCAMPVLFFIAYVLLLNYWVNTSMLVFFMCRCIYRGAKSYNDLIDKWWMNINNDFIKDFKRIK